MATTTRTVVTRETVIGGRTVRVFRETGEGCGKFGHWFAVEANARGAFHPHGRRVASGWSRAEFRRDVARVNWRA